MMLSFVLLKGTLLIYTVGFVNGFIPTAVRLTFADLLLSNDGRSFTHADLTRGAILRVAADVLIDNPNPDNEDSTRSIQQILGSLSVSCLLDAYYGTLSQGIGRAREKYQLERAIDDCNNFNAKTDTDEVTVAAAHFDSEQFEDAQARLVEFREIITMEISSGNHGLARRFMGRLLHTLQDFYSHSNWIEIADERGVTNPSPNLALGERGMSVGNTAGPTTPTCLNCMKTGEIILDTIIGLVPFVNSVSRYDDCEDNIIVLADGVLTSGYADGARDSQNTGIDKPSGKCSHGGIIDGTQDSPATGGINKDSVHEVLSPHHALHARAATTAQQHSYIMLSRIRSDVNNDELFGEFLGLEIEENRVVSLAVLVDITITQEEHQEIVTLIRQTAMDIDQYIRTYENDLQVQYVLVTVNNSAIGNIFETTDSNQLANTVAGLSLQDSSGDNTVPAVEAILTTAIAIEPGSSILVFTNSFPSAENLLGQAEAIIAQKNLKVIFIHDASSIVRRSIGDLLRLNKLRHKRFVGISPLYIELEIFSGGGVISVPTAEISDLSTFISFSAIESDSVMLRRQARSSDTFPFFVDSYTFRILIFINGLSIDVSAVTTPQGTNATILSQYSEHARSNALYIATINIDDPLLYGQWTITITSQGSYCIRVLGDGELTFVTDIITTHPHTTDDINDLKPLIGLNMSAELIIVGSATPINITTLDIINEEEVIQSITLMNNVSDNFVAMFMPPQEEFKMQVTGVDDNGQSFSYVSDISVEPTNIRLTFGENDNGYLTLRPGTGSNITILLLNVGVSDQFRISVIMDASIDIDDTAVQYTISNDRPVVSQNTKEDIIVNVYFSNDIPAGLSITFTVVAQSESDYDVNDFITFDVVNVRQLSSSASGIHYIPQLGINLLTTSLVLLLMLNLVWA